MNKKATKFRETRGNGHPSQNDLPSIDKFSPDYWYYREEMDEPDDIDINYENESKNMNKKVIRLTESELRRMISESVRSVLREGGIHGMQEQVPKVILNDIESNFDNASITPMDSSWYAVGINGKYGDYEIDIPANGHCRIKMYRYNSHGNSEDNQWYYYSTEWFNYCENNSTY